MQKCRTMSNKDTFEEKKLKEKLTHPDLTTLNTRSTNFVSFHFCLPVSSFPVNSPFTTNLSSPSLNFPFPTRLSLIGTHTCMQLENVFTEIEGSHPGGVMPRCIVEFTPLFALDCLQIGHSGQPAIFPLTDIDEDDLTF